ncbi:MAG TPA: cyclic nucleotide-binding domain-containing protein [Bauldia sp.]|nr:cyclic nucleotide-binding domain-containing protein [Bauldia sp.]
MRSDDLDLIRALPLFAGIDVANFDALMRAAYFQRFPEAVRLIGEGDAPDFLHVVVEGVVALTGSGNGRETVIELVRPIETFILAAVVRDQAYLMSARTLSASRILMVPSRDVRAVFEADSIFARAVVTELAGRYRGVVKALKGQKLRTSAERLANYILHQDREQGGTGRVRLAIEKRTLASLLGMTPENLSRAFATLAGHGVTVNGPDVAIDRRAALVAFAGPSPLIDDPLT